MADWMSYLSMPVAFAAVLTPLLGPLDTSPHPRV
jgi:hypothetical protein